MTEKVVNEERSLWVCLHDGELTSLHHDSLERTITLFWNVGYLREFHNLAEKTRFQITLQDASELQVLGYEPWPGAREPARKMAWDEQEVIRREDSEKAAYTSRDWPSFASKIGSAEYECRDAGMLRGVAGKLICFFDLANSSGDDFPRVQITCMQANFTLTPGRHLSAAEFLAMGEAYWNAFAARAAELSNKKGL